MKGFAEEDIKNIVFNKYKITLKEIDWTTTPEDAINKRPILIKDIKELKWFEERENKTTYIFCISVKKLTAKLCIMKCTPSTTRIIHCFKSNVISESILIESLEEAGETIEKNGIYPINIAIRNKLRFILDKEAFNQRYLKTNSGWRWKQQA